MQQRSINSAVTGVTMLVPARSSLDILSFMLRLTTNGSINLRSPAIRESRSSLYKRSLEMHFHVENLGDKILFIAFK